MGWVENGWVAQIFEAKAADGGVVRRNKQDVEQYASLDQVVDAA